MKFIGKCLLIKEKGKKILAVGDLHLGFEESLEVSGVDIESSSFNEMIDYFEAVFRKTGRIDEIILLGDVKHDFGSIRRQEWKDALGLLGYLNKKCKKIILIRGNHDRIIEPIARQHGVAVKDFYVLGRCCFLHGNRDFKEIYQRKIKKWVMGHGHPAVKISDGVKLEKYKCFLVGSWRGKKVVIVPSFFEVSVGTDPRENCLGLAWNFCLKKFDVKIVSGGLDVLDFGKLGNLVVPLT